MQSPPLKQKNRSCEEETGGVTANSIAKGYQEVHASGFGGGRVTRESETDSFDQCYANLEDTHRTQSSNELSDAALAELEHVSSF